MSVDKFEQKLREKFEGVSIPPSPELWGNIESRIPQKEKKRGVIWLWAGGISVAASLLIGLWLSNVNLQSPLESQAGMSQVEQANPQVQEDILQKQTIKPNPQSYTYNQSAQGAPKETELQTALGSSPTYTEPASDPRRGGERSAAQNDNIQFASNVNPNESAKQDFNIRALDHKIAYESLSEFSFLQADPTQLYLDIEINNWWEEFEAIEAEEESVPRWAVNIQAGQDLVGDVNANFGIADTEPSEFFVNQKASNDGLLGTADFVQFARNPNPAFSQEGVDQATLISYPTQESRVKVVGEYKLEGNWSIRSGLGFGISNQGGLTQANVVYSNAATPGTDIDGEWSYNDGPSLQNIQLEVPVSLQYKITRPKGAIVLGTGFSFNRNLNNLSQARYASYSQDNSTSIRTVFSVSDQANALLGSPGENTSQSIGYRSWNNFVLLQAQYE
ncbi:MAG: hypothetical protein AAFN10_27355, partial [Bacteroidota bacterium]